FTGKSTLVHALVRQGATYFSDEFAVLDGKGRVHPYPKPIFLRQPEAGGREQVTAEELGGAAGKRSLPVLAVLLCKYKPGTRMRLVRSSPGQALLALLSHTVSARRKPKVVLTTLRRVVDGAPVYNTFRGEAEEAATILLTSLGDSHEAPARRGAWSVDRRTSGRGRRL
ncbi:MAG: hypothetical protein AB7K24_03020, partial [Gemmataceae bacterium]